MYDFRGKSLQALPGRIVHFDRITPGPVVCFAQDAAAGLLFERFVGPGLPGRAQDGLCSLGDDLPMMIYFRPEFLLIRSYARQAAPQVGPCDQAVAQRCAKRAPHGRVETGRAAGARRAVSGHNG